MRPLRAAVVGGGIGGLTAAGELAARGLEVTLFEASGALGGKAGLADGGQVRFDTGPTLLTMPDLVRGAFARLGALERLPRLLRLERQCAYRWPDGSTFDVYDSLERSVASAAAAFGASEGEALRRFYVTAEAIAEATGAPYLDAAYEGPLDFMVRVARRSLRSVWRGSTLSTLDQLAARTFSSPQLRQFAGRFATYAGASPYEASAAFAQIAHLERAQGVFHPEGGMRALVQGLVGAVTAQGVTVRLNARAQWRRQGDGWRVGPPGDEAEFDVVVVNADPLASVGRGGEPKALSGYVVLFEVDRRLSLPHHAISFSADSAREFAQLFAGRVPEDPTVYLCHPATTDPSMASPGVSGVYAMVNAPVLGASDDVRWAEEAQRLEALCWSAVCAHCPEAASAQHRVVGRRTPQDLQALGAPGGSIYGFLPHGRFGPFRRPRMRGPKPGLFFVGGGTHPGGGVPLVMRSGQLVAGLVSEDLQARGAVLREPLQSVLT